MLGKSPRVDWHQYVKYLSSIQDTLSRGNLYTAHAIPSNWWAPLLDTFLTALPSGKPGCKNIRLGGDSVLVPSNSLDGGQFSTYVVYRSFKYPPPTKPLVEPMWVRSNPVKWIKKRILRVFSTRVVFPSSWARGWTKMKSCCARLQLVTLLSGFPCPVWSNYNFLSTPED